MRFFKEFIQKNEKKFPNVEASLTKFNEHPSLARNLAALWRLTSPKKDICLPSENPYLDEMAKYGISVEDIQCFAKYEDFENKRIREERKAYSRRFYPEARFTVAKPELTIDVRE